MMALRLACFHSLKVMPGDSPAPGACTTMQWVLDPAVQRRELHPPLGRVEVRRHDEAQSRHDRITAYATRFPARRRPGGITG